jgi:hypothetical protein
MDYCLTYVNGKYMKTELEFGSDFATKTKDLSIIRFSQGAII